ncbi:MarR family winged helix-turn-helix transcriptional regulator [Azonexus sp.]|uniref:MarR family winged helix-turn-helix transcriptional regulator n=1 Tax=Azonexus sp. TaxID=1872668 RepID=UPI0039E2B131
MSAARETQKVLDVLQQFRLIYGSMRRHFRRVEEMCGMSGSQVWLLQELSHSPGIGVGELALRMGIHQSTCSLLVDKLAGQNYLRKERHALDQRRVGLYLHTQGEAVLARIPQPAAGILAEALSNLPGLTLHTLHSHLEELLRHLPGKEEKYARVPLADLLGEPGVSLLDEPAKSITQKRHHPDKKQKLQDESA